MIIRSIDKGTERLNLEIECEYMQKLKYFARDHRQFSTQLKKISPRKKILRKYIKSIPAERQREAETKINIYIHDENVHNTRNEQKRKFLTSDVAERECFNDVKVLFLLFVILHVVCLL